MFVLQNDLNQLVDAWNSHRMRPDHKTDRHGARPDLLYNLPELQGSEDKMVPVDITELDACWTESRRKGCYPCDIDIFDISCLLIEENNWDVPNDGYEATTLYIRLRAKTRHELGLD